MKFSLIKEKIKPVKVVVQKTLIENVIQYIALIVSFLTLCFTLYVFLENKKYNNNLYKPILAYDGNFVVNNATGFGGAMQLKIDQEQSDFTISVLGNVMKYNREHKKNDDIYAYSINFKLKNIGNGTAKNIKVFDIYDSSYNNPISFNSIERFNNIAGYDFSSILIESGVEVTINMLIGCNKNFYDDKLNDNYTGILLYKDLNNNTHFIIIRFDIEDNDKNLHIYNSDTIEYYNYIRQYKNKEKLINEAMILYNDICK